MLSSAWLLLAPPLMLRALLPTRSQEMPWSWRKDVPFLLLISAGVVLCCAFWVSRFSIGDKIISSDFHDMCIATEAVREDIRGMFSGNRSWMAAWTAGVLARRLGVIDGLLAAALLHSWVMVFGIGLGARALAGRMAALIAMLSVMALPPLAVLPRTASLYPAFDAAITLSLGLTLVACRWRSPWTLALGSAGAGLVFLADARGLIWGLSTLGVLALVLLVGLYENIKNQTLPRWRRGLMGLLWPIAGIGPMIYSYILGRWAYMSNSASLEMRIDVQHFFMERSLAFISRPGMRSRYIWGWSSPWEIPKTLRWLYDEQQHVPKSWATTSTNVWIYGDQVAPWVGPFWVVFLLSCWYLRKQLGMLGALLLALVPFAAAQWATVTMVDLHVRFLGSTYPVLALLLGLAWVSVGDLLPMRYTIRRLQLPASDLLIHGSFFLLLVLGIIPSWLSPVAAWRQPIISDDSIPLMVYVATHPRTQRVTDVEAQCMAALSEDMADDPESGTHIYGPEVMRLTDTLNNVGPVNAPPGAGKH